jgi:hypothetical protein
LRQDAGRDERGDEDCEPDPDHAQQAITGRGRTNRVFPSKRIPSLYYWFRTDQAAASASPFRP